MKKFNKFITILPLFALSISVFFGLSFYFTLHPQFFTPTSAATVIEAFEFDSGFSTINRVYVTYDNTFGTIESVTGEVSWSLHLSLTIEAILNSGYSWSANSCTIAMTGNNDGVMNPQFTRSSNQWSTNGFFAQNILNASLITFTFPFEDLVERSSYSISYNLNGGNVSGSPPTSYSTSTSARSYTIANPTRDYYNFTGWAISRSSSGGAAPTISGTTLSIPANSYGNITLTANWELQKFNLTFRSNNTALGYVTPAMESSPQNALASYSSTATTVHPLAEFLWWTDENGTIISYEETITIPSLTANTIRIAVFRANGTAVTAYSGGEVRARSNGEQVTLTAIPYAGCAFSSWVVANGTLTLENPNSSTITLPLAMLNGVVLRPTFTGGTAVTNSPLAKASTGGEVRMNATTLNGTDYIHLSALTFAGYEFTGWTAQTSSGEAIDLSAYGATCDIPMSLVEGVIIIANFTEKPSINHNPETDNSGGEFD